MKINSISFKRSFEPETRKLNFTSNFNYIYNEKNATGKTTLVRALLYALGFSIPSTKKIKFDEFTFEIEMETKGEIYNITRKANNISINNMSFSLPNDTQIVHATLFQDDNYDLIDNILGAIYIDQDRGWTLLNRGSVIGLIKFYIEEFLHGLKGMDSDITTKVKLRSINNEIDKYKQMKTLAEYKDQINETTGKNEFEKGKISFDTHSEKLLKARKELVYQKNIIEKEIRFLNETMYNDRIFVERLEKYNIIVKTKKGEFIHVTRENIENYTDNTELNKIEIRKKHFALKRLNEKIVAIENEMDSDPTLDLNGDTLIQQFNESISDMPIDTVITKKILNKLSKKQSALRETLKESAQMQNKWVDKMNIYISDYAKELEVSEYLDNPVNVFMRELKGLSGAIYHKIVFIFRISYARVLSEKFGYKVTLFIDSPNGREIEKQAVEKMIAILERDFSDHQVFLASIFNFIKEDKNNIVIKVDGKMFDINTGQKYLF